MYDGTIPPRIIAWSAATNGGVFRGMIKLLSLLQALSSTLSLVHSALYKTTFGTVGSDSIPLIPDIAKLVAAIAMYTV